MTIVKEVHRKLFYRLYTSAVPVQS